MPKTLPRPPASSAPIALDQLLDEGEAAKLLGLRKHTLAVQRCNGRHQIPFVKVGRAIRYRPADVAAFIQANVIPARAAK